MQSFGRGLQLGAVLMALAVWGCSQDEIKEYTAPKTDFSSRTVVGGHEGHDHSQVAEEPKWDLPAKWSEHPGSGLRFATLHVDAATPPTELRVTPLALTAADPLSNVNRWASQIGLPPYQPSQLGSVLQEVDSHGRVLQMVNLTGPATDSEPAKQILAAIIAGDKNAWFFMIMDEHDRVGPMEKEFETFMLTVQLTTAAEHAAAQSALASAGDEPLDRPGNSHENMTWRPPQNWVLQPAKTKMRVATFIASAGSDSAEVTITKFPGDVGGMLPNINRWRRQLGLPAVGSLADQPLEDLEVDATPSQFLDLVADPNSESAQRMFVVTVARYDMTWFIKMTGTASFLETQRAAYDDFIANVGFAGGTPR